MMILFLRIPPTNILILYCSVKKIEFKTGGGAQVINILTLEREKIKVAECLKTLKTIKNFPPQQRVRRRDRQKKSGF